MAFLRVPRLAAIAAGFVVIALSPLTAAVRPPKLQYQISTLPNGLRVILSEDHSTPIVHVSVWYHVGSKNERAGHTGFAHLFEHMMFKGSKNVEPDSHTSIIASVGGRSNAYTTEDETVFWQTLPAHYLPLALWLEADRMATLRLDDDAFRRELEAASITDVRDFHSTYYVPENATVTVVGDFDSLQALQMVTQYFARVPKG